MSTSRWVETGNLLTHWGALLAAALIGLNASAADKLPFSGPLVDGKQFVLSAKVVILIDKSDSGDTAQSMRVYVDGQEKYHWSVSTGRDTLDQPKSGKKYWSFTPRGVFRPQRLDAHAYSDLWKAEIPYAIYFQGGWAIHETHGANIAKLGTKASGGCVRLHPDHAPVLFKLVAEAGKKVVPVFNRDGSIKSVRGTPVQTEQYDTLIVIEEREAM